MVRLVHYFFALGLCGVALSDDASRLAFFEKSIRPALIAHCYECHSEKAKKIKGGLLLDSRAGWQTGGDSGPAIIPGNPEESIFIQAVTRGGVVPEMPPRESLSAEEVANFTRWIRDGALDPREGKPGIPAKPKIDLEEGRQFWSFQARKKDEESHSVDQFIRPAGLRAGPEKLLRRLYFDLTGLPPSRAEFGEFLAHFEKDSQAAVSTLVDDLLSRSSFGEKWARHWLDLARFADSNGGDINLTYKEAWRYRNYVIDAFNHDMPFDRFITEQVAGDLLPFDSIEERNRQLIATGFLMVGPKMLSERDKAKMRLDIVDEQLDTVGRAVMGLTMGCARCHDHKFDPIPTEDYYAMAGIFYSSVTAHGIRMNNVNVSGWHEMPLALKEADAVKLAAFKKEMASLDEKIKAQKAVVDGLKKSGAVEKLAGVVVDDTEAKVVGNWRKSRNRPDYIGASYLANNKADQDTTYIAWKAKLEKSGLYEVRLGCGYGNGIDSEVPVTVIHDAGKKEIKIDQSKPGTIGGFWHVLGRFSFKKGVGEVILHTRGTSDFVLADAVQFIPVEEIGVPPKKGSDRSPLSEAGKQLESLEKEKKKLAKGAPKELLAMAVKDRDAADVEDLGIRIRGEPRNIGPVVPRGFLQVVSFDSKVDRITASNSGRLELAQWLTDPQHPLTSRVFVNRVWQHLFGEGIVRTVDNFGTLGDRPSHPELLDWLAAEFIGSEWSIKDLIRKIVLSKTYQQEALSKSGSDPENRGWHHQNRRPLPAEAIRDSLLAVSGSLDHEPVASSVSDLGDSAISNSASQGGGLGKLDKNMSRSIYLPMLRNAMPKVLEIFDMANPDMATGQRASTTVPAQALYLMNAPFVRHQAELTADRLLTEADSLSSAVTDLYITSLSRRPDTSEMAEAQDYINALQIEEKISEKEAFVSYIQALFSSTEFRFLE